MLMFPWRQLISVSTAVTPCPSMTKAIVVTTFKAPDNAIALETGCPKDKLALKK